MEQLNKIKDVIKLFEVGDQNWNLAANLGHFAETFISDNWIIQYRDSLTLERDIIQKRILKNVNLPGVKCHVNKLVLETKEEELILINTNNSPEIKYDDMQGYWSIQEKLPGKTFNTRHASPKKIIKLYRKILRPLSEELLVLQNTPVTPEDKKALLESRVGRGLELQIKDKKELLVVLGRQYPKLINQWSKIPKEKESEVILSHGDPTLKNIIINKKTNSANLIDWETIYYLPKHVDYVHSLVQILKYLPKDHWQELMAYTFAELKQIKVLDWSYEEWQTSVTWGYLREILNFPPGGMNYEEIYNELKTAPSIILK